ncbi:tripartite tricarboxylate transporter TctB family protein [Qingshengfaniella alkalisoli]|uniref:Tripartite tricarboxylate transporter TctB family protein n=1 Tax=Qingshengfaniella alkalisoli TaxID=2599296 RepID=A0A5B8IY27_9RHOB|nr:tripartite tricarboxylate transporter TctB family protein [Qingshengfaniella alkalisoli]QDY70644.1 tripartite tricarboxylate transporter TctB family protein [Qingshengfaniella alkalisoli]
MRIDNRLFGIAIVLLGAAVIYEARHLPKVPGSTFGPGLMPTIIGICFSGLGIKIALSAFMKPADGMPLVDFSAWNNQGRGIIAAIWTLMGALLSILFLQPIGFPLLAVIYVFPLMLLMKARPVPAAIVAATTVLGLHYVFTNILFVPLPSGLLPLPW